MSHEDPLVDGRLTRRQALIGAGTAAFGVSLFGPASFGRFSPFGTALAGAATAGSPVSLLLRPQDSGNMNADFVAGTKYPGLKYIESFIHAADGTPTTGSTSSFPGQWLAYVKAGSVYKAGTGGDPGDELAGTDPLVLRDTRYNQPIIGPVTGSEYMPDLTNKLFRDKVVAICQRAISTGHTGIWLDNVLNPIYSYFAQDGSANGTMLGKQPAAGGAIPMPKRADGTLITVDAWNAGSASLLTELRAALGASVPILSNVLWFAPYDEGVGGTYNNVHFRTVAAKSTYLNREIWVIWGNSLVAGWDMESQFDIVEQTRSLVPTSAFTYEVFPTHSAFPDANTHREYGLAAAYLDKTPADLFSDNTFYGGVDWTGYHLDLGAPTTGRVQITGKYAWTRTFASGFVAFNAETTAVNVTLPAGVTYRKLDGTTVTGTISLPANRGLLLTVSPGPAVSLAWGTPAAPPVPVNLSATDPSLGAPRDWRYWYGSLSGNQRTRNTKPTVFSGSWTKTGTGTVGTYSSATQKFTWNDASGAVVAPTTTTAPLITATSTGLQFNIKAYASETRTLKLYLGIRGLNLSAALTASFPTGGSAAKLVTSTSDTVLQDRVVTLTYRPERPFDTMLVQLILVGAANPNAQLILYAAEVF